MAVLQRHLVQTVGVEEAAALSAEIQELKERTAALRQRHPARPARRRK